MCVIREIKFIEPIFYNSLYGVIFAVLKIQNIMEYDICDAAWL